MVVVLMVLLVALGLGNLVCGILLIVAAFKNEKSPVLGILSIVLCFSVGGFIIGWMKHKQWGITRLMLIWSALFVAGFAINIVVNALALGGAGVPTLP